MKRLLSIEFSKLWGNRAARVLILAYFILLSFIALLASVNFKIIGIDFRLADQGIFNFPYIWHFNTWIAAFLKFFLAIVIVSMIANEYTYGTLKQNLIDGLSKKEFILSKFITVVVFAAFSAIFMFFLTLMLGYSFSSYTETSIVFTDIVYIFAYFLKLVAFFSFCLFAGVLVKRSAFALGFVLVWWIAEGIIFLVLRWKIIKDGAITDNIMQFFPLDAMANLIKEPFTRFETVRALEMANGTVSVKDYGVHWYSVLIVIIWTLIFILTSYRIVKKRDL